MLTRRQTLVLGAALAAAVPAIAMAATPVAFAQKQFDEAKAAGKPVVVHINATWCPTCQAQKPILRSLLDDKRFKGFEAFEVDYDTKKDVMRALNAPDRSTIIVFSHGKEVARTVGDTSQAGIEAALAKAL